MGKEKKKGKSGTAITYINRNQAIKRLQISLSDFRRLCILKGIYPHDPKHRHKLDKGKDITQPQTYYLLKDIQYLSHEPLIEKFREFKIFATKLRKYTAKKDHQKANLVRQSKPKFKFDHIIKERYPNFADAIRDLDDCLTLCTLFSKMPKTKSISSGMVNTCKRLTIEFSNFVLQTRALRKVFLSIKGIYYQISIMGQLITWVVPYEFPFTADIEVDLKMMCTFIDFYINLLGFVNYKLYTDNNLIYPPKFSRSFATNSIDTEISMYTQHDSQLERLGSFNEDLLKINNDVYQENLQSDLAHNLDDEELKILHGGTIENEVKDVFDQNLFQNLRFFLNREVPKDALTFIIKSFGGVVSWPDSCGIGFTYDQNNEKITHQIVDRNNDQDGRKIFRNRYYIQPQWVFDCVNAQKLLDVQPYFPSTTQELPPHTSPFYEMHPSNISDDEEAIEDREGASNPERPSKRLKSDKQDDDAEINDITKPRKNMGKKHMRSEHGRSTLANSSETSEKAYGVEKEEKKLQEMMLSKKYKRLYHKMKKVQQFREKEAKQLKLKRKKLVTNATNDKKKIEAC
ncbi:unnamed protein product [Gordionus sp. m RMFG-2023]|uniref:pescadillo homolog n=1 Tax=Gordionus sp. m RMFG-2023 TaxID=3053472 RepID=UPI0030E03123